MRAIPSCIKQEKLDSMKAQVETRRIEKSEVLKWDPKVTKLIEDSVYDTKPINSTSMISEQLKWVVNKNE